MASSCRIGGEPSVVVIACCTIDVRPKSCCPWENTTALRVKTCSNLAGLVLKSVTVLPWLVLWLATRKCISLIIK